MIYLKENIFKLKGVMNEQIWGNHFSEGQKQSSGDVLLKSLLKYFAKFTGKNLCQSLFFKKETPT